MKSLKIHSPATVFLLTYFAVTFRRSALEIWSLSKSHIEEEMGFTSLILGLFDAAYLVCYAFGECLNGYLCETIPESRIISTGLLTAGVCLITLSVLSYVHYANVVLFIVFWLVEGYSHSTVTPKQVLPGGVSLMNKYYSAESRGKVMGLWGSAASAGNLLGIFMFVLLSEHFYLPWAETLGAASLLIVLIAVGIICTFVNDQGDELLLNKQKVGIFDALKVEGILVYTLAYTCCKFINYAWMMWLPYYLETQVGVSRVFIGWPICAYEFGSVVGTFSGGWVSDLVKSRTGTVQVMLSFVTPLSIVLWYLKSDAWVLIIFICFGLGVSAAGVCYLINVCAGADLSKTGKQIGAISGLMDGVASLITGLGILFIGFIQSYSWFWVFLIICSADILAILIIQTMKSK